MIMIEEKSLDVVDFWEAFEKRGSKIDLTVIFSEKYTQKWWHCKFNTFNKKLLRTLKFVGFFLSKA